MIKVVISSLILVINISLGIYYYQHVFNNETEIIEEFMIIESNNKPESELVDVEIYPPNANGKHLTKEIIFINKNNSKENSVRQIFNNLKFESSELPLGSNIINIFFEGKNLYLNFNYQITINMTSPEKEMMIIYSIVNSLTNLDYIEKVKFLRENKETEFVGNYIKANDFFTKNNLLIRGDS